MAADSLAALRDALARGETPVCVDAAGSTVDIGAATALQLKSGLFPLDEPTRFVPDGTAQPLRVVLQAWLHAKLLANAYLSDSETHGIPTLLFLHRTDLTTYLSGASDQLQFVEVAKDSSAPAAIAKTEITDPFLRLVYAHERALVDHNTALRGAKQADFGYVAREAEQKLVSAWRKADKAQSSSRSAPASSSRAAVPIIVLLPLPSALLSLANVKHFLGDGVFVSPQEAGAAPGGLVKLTHKLERLGKLFSFLVVDNVAQLTKPEYWDRVVAIFTTGQAWQFKQYPNGGNPQRMFRNIKGFYLGYTGDAVPAAMRDWNVEVVQVDRTRRFRDRQALEALWDSLDKWMGGRGW